MQKAHRSAKPFTPRVIPTTPFRRADHREIPSKLSKVIESDFSKPIQPVFEVN